MRNPVWRPAISAPLCSDSHSSFPAVRGITAIVCESEDRQRELKAQSTIPSNKRQMRTSVASLRGSSVPKVVGVHIVMTSKPDLRISTRCLRPGQSANQRSFYTPVDPKFLRQYLAQFTGSGSAAREEGDGCRLHESTPIAEARLIKGTHGVEALART